MYIDPGTLSWIFISGASVCAFMIGYTFARRKDDKIISATIDYLVNEGFVRSYENEDGELELIKLRDGEFYGKRSTQDDDEA